MREKTKTGSKKRNNGAGGLAGFVSAQSGAPKDYFLLNVFSEEQKCLELSTALGRLKISRLSFHSRAIFKAYLTNSRRVSEV